MYNFYNNTEILVFFKKKRLKVHENGYLSEASKYKYTKSNTKQRFG